MMMKLLVVAATVALTALPACAEHMTLVDASRETRDEVVTPPSRTLDIDIKLGANAFRIGGRWFGDKGVGGAWLNGQVGANGFSLDGRVQGDTGKAYNFKLDADMMDVVTRTAWQWFLRRPLAE
jgi:hypothetical protein